jgi:hypothetical protein
MNEMKLRSVVCKVASHFSSNEQSLEKCEHLPASGADVNQKSYTPTILYFLM